jgi:hypothetical protein
VREGYGKYIVDHQTIFDGYWKNDLPWKNRGASNEDGVVEIEAINIGTVKVISMAFKGTIMKDKESGWLVGECEIYQHDKPMWRGLLYSGKYRAPTLDSVLLQSMDMELKDYVGLLPKTNFLSC